MTGLFLEFDISREIRQLQEEDAWRAGRNSKALAKYDDFRIVLIALKEGVRIEEHRAEGRISIHTVVGHISVRALGRTFDLPAGRLLTLDRATVHNVGALEESAILLTISWPEAKEQ
jgi:quercetin dioxygenase-like cupin family protein